MAGAHASSCQCFRFAPAKEAQSMHSQVLNYDLWLRSLRWLARAGSLAVIVLLLLFIFGEGNS